VSRAAFVLHGIHGFPPAHSKNSRAASPW
jgi:hypothetical protein